MKAPDKIYLQHYYKPEALSEDWSLVSHPIEKNEEYIRKDALIEWAKENMDSLGRLSYGEFIDKLNSM
jgi:hypothetical protein